MCAGQVDSDFRRLPELLENPENHLSALTPFATVSAYVGVGNLLRCHKIDYHK